MSSFKLHKQIPKRIDLDWFLMSLVHTKTQFRFKFWPAGHFLNLAPNYADGLSITKLFTELQLNCRNLPDKQCSGQIISSKLFSMVYLSKSLQEQHESFFWYVITHMW